MFGYSIIKTKKLEQLYDSSSEIAVSNQRLKAQNDRLVKYCQIMADKLKQYGRSVPEWWVKGL